MAARAKNKRCPFQEECGKKCEHVNSELECTYYKNNAVGDNVIPDQEELIDKLYKAKMRVYEEELIANLSEDPDLIESDSFSATATKGELSKMVVVKKIGLGYLIPSEDNFFTVEEDISDLAEDIKVNGLLTPLTVCPAKEDNFYRIISGHRRYKALCSIYKNSFEIPCVVTAPVSPEAEAYMLIQANMTSRVLNWNDTEKARKKAEEVLLALKKQGVQFPGKLRSHVAKLLKVSEAQLAKVKYVSEHLIKDIQDVDDNKISFDNKYNVSHWPEDIQKDFYEARLKNGFGVWNTIGFNKEIKEGKNPFVPSSGADVKKVKNCRYNTCPCENEEKFEQLKEKELQGPGITFHCEGYCCFYCRNRYICGSVCSHTSSFVDKRGQEEAAEYLYSVRARKVIRDLLIVNGLTYERLKELEDDEKISFEGYSRTIYTDPFEYDLSLNDCLVFLSLLKITPDRFFTLVKKSDYLSNMFSEEDSDFLPKFEIYLGEEGEKT